MTELPLYVRTLPDEDLILNRLREQGHRFHRFSVGCFEAAVLIHRLRDADRDRVAQCVRVLDFTLIGLRRIDQANGLRCVKCEAKGLLFASRIAERGFERRARQYERRAASILPPRSLPLSLPSLQAEVRWYLDHVSSRAGQ